MHKQQEFNLENELRSIRDIVSRWKTDYLRQIQRGADNSYLYTEFCQDIERHAEPHIMRLVKLEILEINRAKRFLSELFMMAMDVYVAGKEIRYEPSP